jgi:catechol 2,3-dioxygenase-like lactoylglutathione lyase family enzyme
MKRMHLHIAVADLETSISFYNTLFGAAPSVVKPDYAKWMLDDPSVNFAISSRSAKIGLDHIGIQVENDNELTDIKARLDTAEMAMVTQEGTNCCYAKSDKHWVQDPSGIAWETYHTLESTPTFNDSDTSEETNSACCAPAVQTIQLMSKSKGCC